MHISPPVPKYPDAHPQVGAPVLVTPPAQLEQLLAVPLHPSHWGSHPFIPTFPSLSLSVESDGLQTLVPGLGANPLEQEFTQALF